MILNWSLFCFHNLLWGFQWVIIFIVEFRSVRKSLSIKGKNKGGISVSSLALVFVKLFYSITAPTPPKLYEYRQVGSMSLRKECISSQPWTQKAALKIVNSNTSDHEYSMSSKNLFLYSSQTVHKIDVAITFQNNTVSLEERLSELLDWNKIRS